jgi:valyl-tRNA synthetase
MSKSKGNVIDPLDVRNGVTLKELQATLEGGNLDAHEIAKAAAGQAADFPAGIPACGVDALRFALCAFTSNSGGSINLDVKRVVGYKKFCNKIWNAVKFVLMSIGPSYTPTPGGGASADDSTADRWIRSRLAATTKDVNEGMKAYDFRKVTTAIYAFWMYDFCASYIEWVKPVIMSDTASDADKAASRAGLYDCCEQALRLISPFMPFISEELWQRLPRTSGDTSPSICVSRFPTDSSAYNPDLEVSVKFVQKVVDTCRSMKADFSIKSSVLAEVFIRPSDAEQKAILEKMMTEITTLAKITATIIDGATAAPAGCSISTADRAEIHMQVAGLVDIGAELEKAKVELAKLHDKVAQITEVLEGPQAAKADAAFLEKKRSDLGKATADVKAKTNAIAGFAKLMGK